MPITDVKCENGTCTEHVAVKALTDLVPAMKDTLTATHNKVNDIYNFLNGLLDKKGFITVIDERLWKVEKWIEDNDKTHKANMEKYELSRRENTLLIKTAIISSIGSGVLFVATVVCKIIGWL